MKKLILSLMAGCAGITAVANISIDPVLGFDVSSDFTSAFTNNTGSNAAATYAQAAGIGLAGSGGVAGVTSDSAPTTQFNTSGSFGVGTPQALSIFFKFDAAGQAQAGNSTRVGIGTVSNGGNSGEFRGVNFQIRNGGYSNDWTARLRVRGQTLATDVAAFTLTDGNWYRMDADFTIINDLDGTVGNFSYNFALYDYGTDGSSLGSTVFSTSATTSGSGDVNVLDHVNGRYLAFIASKSDNGYGISAVDNFGTVAVPEPSTYALLTALAGLGVVMMRRRR